MIESFRDSFKKIKLPFIIKATCVLISVVILGYVLKIGQSIIAPFFLAFLLAMLFTPFSNFMERKMKIPRGISTFLAVIMISAVVLGLGFFFTTQLSDFSNDFPKIKSQATQVFHTAQEWVNHTFHINADEQFEYINKGVDKMISSSGEILGFVLGILSTSLGFFAFFIVFFIFILAYRRILYNFIVDVFADEHKQKVEFTVKKIQKMTQSYIVGLMIQIILVSSLTTLGLTIVGAKYALLLGILTGLINVIPYLGIVLSLLIASFVTFATGTPIMVLYVVIVYVIVHTLDGNIFVPFIIGSQVQINALFSFLGILIGEQLWGISGMFLCIPALAIIKIILEEIEDVSPWGDLLGEGKKPKRKKKRIKISKEITLEEKD